MKQITIDYTVSPASVSDKILGNQGESLATELAVKLPAEMINDSSIAGFCGAFGSCNGVFHSKRIAKGEVADGVLSVPITAEISSNLTVSFQIEAFSSDDSLIMKTSLIEGLTFNKSVCRNHSDLSKLIDPADLANITAEIKANTLARHTHSNTETLNKLGDSNGKLTYDGKPVGGGERATAEVSFTQEWSDFLISTDTTSKKVSITVNSDSLTTETEIKSISVLFEGQQDYIDLRDLTLHINEDCEPCTVAYYHPSIDEGESGFAGLRVAALYFPISGRAYQFFNSNSYSAVKIVYYIGG